MMTEAAHDPITLASYRKVVAKAGGVENHILAKSSLFKRLQDGQQALVIPPPLNHSYPWYRAVESDEPTEIPFGPAEWTPDWDTRHGIAICQDVWSKIDGDAASDLTVTYPGWAELGFVWRVWQVNRPAESTSAALCCWHRNDIGSLTTPDLVEAECRWRVERLARWAAVAGECTDDELKAKYIDSGEAGAPGDQFMDVMASIAVSQFRHFAEKRRADGLQLMLRPDEIQAEIQAEVISLLGESWVIEGEQLLHRGWQIQRISPPSLGPEHYLELV